MNGKEFDQCVKSRITKCLDTLCVKAKEYANNDDRLRSFWQAATIEKVSPYEALGGMLAKHIISIYDMLPTAERHSSAKWDEKIGDAINYLLLLDALLVDGQKGKCISLKDAEDEDNVCVKSK